MVKGLVAGIKSQDSNWLWGHPQGSLRVFCGFLGVRWGFPWFFVGSVVGFKLNLAVPSQVLSGC